MDTDSVSIKAWVVRSSAMSIQFGGLERLFIHFSKPTYAWEKVKDSDRDTPFGFISEREGLYSRLGWQSTQKTWVNTQSVGSWLGYDNPISMYIWDKLCEHFLGAPFDDWNTLEKEGKCNVEDFILEIELSLSIKNANGN